VGPIPNLTIGKRSHDRGNLVMWPDYIINFFATKKCHMTVGKKSHDLVMWPAYIIKFSDPPKQVTWLWEKCHVTCLHNHMTHPPGQVTWLWEPHQSHTIGPYLIRCTQGTGTAPQSGCWKCPVGRDSTDFPLHPPLQVCWKPWANKTETAGFAHRIFKISISTTAILLIYLGKANHDASRAYRMWCELKSAEGSHPVACKPRSHWQSLVICGQGRTKCLPRLGSHQRLEPRAPLRNIGWMVVSPLACLFVIALKIVNCRKRYGQPPCYNPKYEEWFTPNFSGECGLHYGTVTYAQVKQGVGRKKGTSPATCLHHMEGNGEVYTPIRPGSQFPTRRTTCQPSRSHNLHVNPRPYRLRRRQRFR